MSLEPEELAIRSAFERRRPVVVPEELAARIDRVPDEVSPLRSLPVRLAMGAAPWAALAGVAVALALVPVMRLPDRSSGGAPLVAAWTAAHPGGGFANVDGLGVPWVWLLALAAVAGATWTVRRVLHGQSLVPRPQFGWPRFDLSGPRPPRTARYWIVSVGPVVVLTLVLQVVWGVLRGDPIVYGTTVRPGPELSEESRGIWWDEKDGSGANMRSGPQYIYRLQPGEAFSYLVSIRNDWPVPITLLGLDGAAPLDGEVPVGVDYVSTGLGLLGDPNVVSPAPDDVVPFQPVHLAPGQEVVLVVASVAGACANPTADPPKDPPNVVTGNRSITFIYDLLGWHRAGWTFPPAEIMVTSTPGCLPRGW